MPDTQIAALASSAIPKVYDVPESAEFVLKAVNASFDGSGAAGAYLPCVAILSDSGHVIARAVDQGVSVAAGGNAEVSWFPWLKHRAAAVTPSGLSCQLLGSAIGNATLTIPLTTAVPYKGTLHVIFAQVTLGGVNDAGSSPTGVVDSNAVAGWKRPTAPGNGNVVGEIRETRLGAGGYDAQVGGCARPCTGGDLGVGSSVTVTFGTGFPASFHTAGLAIFQPAYFTPVTQASFLGGFYAIQYGINSANPDNMPDLNRLSWDDYYGPPPWEFCSQDAHMITAMGSYPPVAGFSPFNGSLIGEETSGSIGIAAGCATQCEGSIIDPGGTWPSNATAVLGNYQIATPRTCTTG